MSVTITNSPRELILTNNGNISHIRKGFCEVWYSEPYIGLEYRDYNDSNTVNYQAFHYTSVTSHTVSNASQLKSIVQLYLDDYVSFTGGTIDNLTISGNSFINILSASTIFSGGTNLYNIFASAGSFISDGTKVNKSGDTMTGTLIAPEISGTSISASTFYSGNTNLSILLDQAAIRSNWYPGTGTMSTMLTPDQNINDSSYSIVGGCANQSINNSSYSSIIAGKSNSVSVSKYGLIGSGYFNSIFASDYSSVLSGKFNTANTTTGSVIIGGKNNTASNGSWNFIFGSYGSIRGTSSSYNSLGGTSNKIYTSIYDGNNYPSIKCGIFAGASNNIGAAYNSVIITGVNNKIGFDEISLDPITYITSNIIGGGQNNAIYKASYSSILGGQSNLVKSSSSLIAGGVNNVIYTVSVISDVGNSILGGQGNQINGGSSYNSIVNGSGNIIVNAHFSSILAGNNNTLNGTSNSSILGGQGYTLSTSNTVLVPKLLIKSLSFSPTGATNFLKTDSTGEVFKFILSGGSGIAITHQTSATTITFTGSSSGGGSTVNNGLNTFTGGTPTFQSVNITAATLSSIYVSGSSRFNSLSGGSISATTFYSGNTDLSSLFVTYGSNLFTNGNSGNYSIKANNGTLISNGNFSLVTGNGNSAFTGSDYITILGGRGNSISDVSPNTMIVGGISNSISDYSTGPNFYSGIIFGLSNKIRTSPSSTIIGGFSNSITGTCNYSIIIGGQYNKINIGSYNSTIIGGIGNKITQYTFNSIILGGNNNNIEQTSPYSSIVGGQGNLLTNNAARSAILGGFNITGSTSDMVYVPNLNINNLSNPVGTANNILFSDDQGFVYKKTISGGTGILINNQLSAITISFSGATSNAGATVNNGINTFTAGTSTFQSVNITAATLSNLTVSGNSILNSLSANTIFSGNTNLYSIFAPIGSGGNMSGNYLPISGGTLTGVTTFNDLAQLNAGLVITTGDIGADNNNLFITNGFIDNSNGEITTLNLYSSGIIASNEINNSGLTYTNTLSALTAFTNYIKVNTQSASTTNPERVIIYDYQPLTYSNVLVGVASALTYAQLNIKNIHRGTQASSDIVATAPNGDENANYIDMGINSSTFNGLIGGGNDGYLYSTGNDLWIGNTTSNKTIKLFTDGTGSTSVRMTISSASTTFNVPVSASTIILSGSSIAPSIAGAKMYIFNNFI